MPLEIPKQKSRLILLSALILVFAEVLSQGTQCGNAEIVTIGSHISDGPGEGAGATGVSCGLAILGPQTHADWYLFTPSLDGIYTITSTNDSSLTDTRLKLWEGSGGCGLLLCIDGDDDNGIGFTSSITVCLTAGVNYYIEWDDHWTTSGFQWDLILEDVLSCEPPSNDSCAYALPVSIGSSVDGATLFATATNSILCGDVSESTSGGIWYYVEGNGTTLTATTCRPGTDYDTQISVFTGSCGSLTCIAGNDDQAGPLDTFCDVLEISLNVASTVEWASGEGTIYYIYVNGFEDKSGHFELLITDPSGPCPPIGQTLLVDSDMDSGSGTLRQTIMDACERDTVVFSANLLGDTILLSGPEIGIYKDLVISGHGKELLHISGMSNSRIFRVYPGSELTMKNITLIEGYALMNGGAFINEGNLKVSDIRFKQNYEGPAQRAFTNQNIIEIIGGIIEVLNQ